MSQPDNYCGFCQSPNTLIVCGVFSQPVNPDLGSCHANFVKSDCEAPALVGVIIALANSWDADGNPIWDQQN